MEMILNSKKNVFLNKKNDRFVLMISRSILALFLISLSTVCFAQEGFKFGPEVLLLHPVCLHHLPLHEHGHLLVLPLVGGG